MWWEKGYIERMCKYFIMEELVLHHGTGKRSKLTRNIDRKDGWISAPPDILKLLISTLKHWWVCQNSVSCMWLFSRSKTQSLYSLYYLLLHFLIFRLLTTNASAVIVEVGSNQTQQTLSCPNGGRFPRWWRPEPCCTKLGFRDPR